MTAASLAQCSYCHATLPASDTFEPYLGAIRCRDVAACERRQIRAFDPTITPDEDRPVPPAATAPAGTACAACRAPAAPGELYDRGGGQWFHRDRAACEREQAYDLAPQTPDDWDPSLEITPSQMRALVSAGGAQIPPEPTVLTPAEIAALAAQEALARKAVPADGALEARMTAIARR